MVATSPNSVFAVRFANPNAFGTSQTRNPLSEIGLTSKNLRSKKERFK